MHAVGIRTSSIRAVLIVVATPLVVLGQSDVPRMISHQGFLVDSGTGDPVADASYNVTFRLYESSSGGAPIWTETQSVSTNGGVFNAALGSVASLDTLQFDRGMWLSTQVAPDAEMTERTRLTSVPFTLGLALPFEASHSSSTALIHLDNTGSSDGILVTNSGSGTAGAFVQEDAGSTETGVYGQSNGMGAAVYGQHFGTGNAGRFRIANVASDAAALLAETDGSGPGAYIKNGRLEVEYEGASTAPHVLIRQTATNEYARLRMRNEDNAHYWDLAAGGVNNDRLNIVRGGAGTLTIMSINTDGRVGIGVGIAQEKLHVSGNVKADSVIYNDPLHGWASVHGSAFLPKKQDGTIEYERSAVFYYTAGSAVIAYAPIQLPHNAHLETLSCRINDLTAVDNLTCELCGEASTGGCVLLGSVSSSGDGGVDTYTTSLSATVNNETQSLFVDVYTESFTNWADHADSLSVVGVSIGYTIGGSP